MTTPVHWADDIDGDRRGDSLPGDTTLDDYREDYEPPAGHGEWCGCVDCDPDAMREIRVELCES